MIEFGFYALWTFFYFAAAIAAAVQVGQINESTLQSFWSSCSR
jgi:hypothetical protein